MGPAVYAFGFGDSHSPHLLKAISDAGNGMYYYIENKDKIATSFGHCLGGLLNTAAKGIQLEVKIENEAVIKNVHTERPFDISDDRQSIVVDMGDLQSEEDRDLVIELSLSKLSAPYEEEKTLLNARVNYFNVISKQIDSKSACLKVDRPDIVILDRGEDSDVIDRQRNRVRAVAAFRKAVEQANENDFVGAQETLMEEIAYIGKTETANHDFCQALIEDMQTCLSNYDKKSWVSNGQKVHMSMVQMHGMQRTSSISSMAYQSKARREMAMKAKIYSEYC